MSPFLGIDDGGAKTQFALIDTTGQVLATPRAGPGNRAAPQLPVAVSCCGGLMQQGGPLLPLFERTLHASGRRYDLHPPLLSPCLGASAFAARLAHPPLEPLALVRLRQSAGRG